MKGKCTVLIEKLRRFFFAAFFGVLRLRALPFAQDDGMNGNTNDKCNGKNNCECGDFGRRSE